MTSGDPLEKVLFIETGFGSALHGQDPTKAAECACLDAISFNSMPSIDSLVPGGRTKMKLRVKIGVPCPDLVDVEALRKVFPYGGQDAHFEIVDGGLAASSGIVLPEWGDGKSPAAGRLNQDDMVMAVAVVAVGY